MADGFLDRLPSKRAQAALDNEAKAVANAPEGTRNDQLNRSAFALGQLVAAGELREPLAVDKLTEAARQAGLGDDEIDYTVRSGLESGKLQPRSSGRSASERAADPLAEMTTADQLDRQNFGETVEHIPGILTAGYSILGGSPKVGKSWLLLDLALACANGGLAMGTVSVEPRAVLYLALEDGEKRLTKRMRQLKHGAPKGLHILTKLQPGWSGIDTINAWLANHAADEHPPLVIVDTLATIQPAVSATTANAYQVDYEFGRALKSAADSVDGAAVLAAHHNRKGDAVDFIHRLSGSVGITAACDCVLALSRDRGSEHATLSVTGKDLEHEDDYSLIRQGPLWVVNGADLATAADAAREQRQIGNLGDRANDILATVNERGQRGHTTTAADFPGIDQPSTYLGRLHKAGRIQKVKRGVYFPAGLSYSAESSMPASGGG